MTVLLTGATGFLGSEVLDQLSERGELVRALVRPTTLERSPEAAALLQRPDVEVVPAELTDADSIRDAADGVEVVYHLGWHSLRRNSDLDEHGDDGSEPAEINLIAAHAIVDACASGHVQRLVVTSSVAVYGRGGDPAQWPINEEADLAETLTTGTYARNYLQPKISLERLVRERAATEGFDYVILRPSIVYGLGWHGVETLKKLASSPDWSRRRPNSELMQPVHVRDAAAACIAAGECHDAANREFNIAGNEVITMPGMAHMYRNAARSRAVHGWQDWGEEGARPRYDITKAQMFLDFAPKTSLHQGIAEIARTPARGPSDGDQSGAVASHAQEVGRVYNSRLNVELVDEYYENSDFWNWGYWDEETENQVQACENLLEHLLARIPKKTGTILDVACGKGATTRHLLRYYDPSEVTGINITEEQLEICKQNAPGCTFLLMDATELKFEDESFDNVICVEAAGHFDTRDAFLREALRVLKPGGRLVLSDAVFAPRFWMSEQQRRVVVANDVVDAERYRTACLRAGFDSVEASDISEQAWEGFSENFEEYLSDRLLARTIGWYQYRAITQWRDALASAFRFYILVACEKQA